VTTKTRTHANWKWLTPVGAVLTVTSFVSVALAGGPISNQINSSVSINYDALGGTGPQLLIPNASTGRLPPVRLHPPQGVKALPQSGVTKLRPPAGVKLIPPKSMQLARAVEPDAPKKAPAPKPAAPAVKTAAPKPAETKMAALPPPAPPKPPAAAPAPVAPPSAPAKPAAVAPPPAPPPAPKAAAVSPAPVAPPPAAAPAVPPPKVAASAPVLAPPPATKPAAPTPAAPAPQQMASNQPAPAVNQPKSILTPPPPPAASAPPTALVAPPAAAPHPAPAPVETQVASLPPPAPTPPAVPDEYKIAFKIGASDVPSDATATLKAMAARINKDPSLRVQLLAFASDAEKSVSRSRRLSLERAVNVRKQLLNAGVDSTRIEVRALGEQSGGGEPDRVDVITTKR